MRAARARFPAQGSAGQRARSRLPGEQPDPLEGFVAKDAMFESSKTMDVRN